MDFGNKKKSFMMMNHFLPDIFDRFHPCCIECRYVSHSQNKDFGNNAHIPDRLDKFFGRAEKEWPVDLIDLYAWWNFLIDQRIAVLRFVLVGEFARQNTDIRY